MKVKLAVAISLIGAGLLVVVILTFGLLVSADRLQRWSNKSSSETSQQKQANGSGTSTDPTSDKTSSTNPDTPTSSTSNGSAPTTSTASGNSGTATSTGSSSTPKTSGSTGGTTASASIASFSASPSSVSYNSASTLSWSSSNASSCSVSPSLGSVATSGSKSTGNLTSSTTYTLTCGTATKTASVSVGAAPVSCGQSGGSCTSAQVAAHSTQGDCWVTYNGYYYIVTSYVNTHPGGKSVFNSSTCGHDITSYMNGNASTAGKQHNHNGSGYSALNSYRIGPVQG